MPGAFFLFWQKEAKTMGRNNHPADSLYRRPCKGGKACGRAASPNKSKKQSRPGGLSWIHSDAPAVYTASESVLWSRKYCLTESGRRGSLFPRRPFATFGPAKVGPRQRLAGDSFQERNQCSPLLSPSRNRLPAPSACRFSRLTIALFKGISFHKPGQASTTVRVEPRPGKNADRRLGLIYLFKKRNGREKNSLPSPTGGVLLTGQKNQKPLAAIIIPPILDTDDPARAASIAAGMLRQKKAKQARRIRLDSLRCSGGIHGE
jgi:hypothetical protein